MLCKLVLVNNSLTLSVVFVFNYCYVFKFYNFDPVCCFFLRCELSVASGGCLASPHQWRPSLQLVRKKAAPLKKDSAERSGSVSTGSHGCCWPSCPAASKELWVIRSAPALAVLCPRVSSSLYIPKPLSDNETWSAAGVSSLEVRCSPTKPCGKGSKRKQDDLDEEEEVDQQSWVEALTQELAEEDHVVDPDYEVSSFLFSFSLPNFGILIFSCSPVELRRTVRNTGHTMTLRVTWK